MIARPCSAYAVSGFALYICRFLPASSNADAVGQDGACDGATENHTTAQEDLKPLLSRPHAPQLSLSAWSSQERRSVAKTKSALKQSSGHKRRFGKKAVRFKGVAGPFTKWFLVTLVTRCRGSSKFATYWQFLLALLTALDFFVLPLSMVVETESELREIQHLENINTTKKCLVFATIGIDIFFILDLLFKAGEGVAVDLGLQDSAVERLARAACQGSKKHSDDSAAEEVLHAYASKKSMWGPMIQHAVIVVAPLEISFMLPLWWGLVWEDGWHLAATHILRIHRVVRLFRFFSSRQEDLSADFRKVALFKYALHPSVARMSVFVWSKFVVLKLGENGRPNTAATHIMDHACTAATLLTYVATPHKLLYAVAFYMQNCQVWPIEHP
jgi:hypothetical protein